MGAWVFDKTEVLSIEKMRNGIRLHTSQGCRVSTKKLVIAAGYEAVNYIPFHLVSLTSTYALISKPLPEKEIWFENCLFWVPAIPISTVV